VEAYSTSNTAVMGAFDTLKVLMDCAAPSSNTRKLSFFKPGTNWPLLVVTRTSTFTNGAFTRME
jgi:hypothetical protein